MRELLGIKIGTSRLFPSFKKTMSMGTVGIFLRGIKLGKKEGKKHVGLRKELLHLLMSESLCTTVKLSMPSTMLVLVVPITVSLDKYVSRTILISRLPIVFCIFHVGSFALLRLSISESAL